MDLQTLRDQEPRLTKDVQQCGAAMEAQDQFELPAQQVLFTVSAEAEATQAGPDVYCPYCGTGNLASAKTCSQCKAELVRPQRARQPRAGSVPDGTCSGTTVSLLWPAQSSQCFALCQVRRRLIKKPAPHPAAPRLPHSPQPLGIALGVGALILLCIAPSPFSR